MTPLSCSFSVAGCSSCSRQSTSATDNILDSSSVIPQIPDVFRRSLSCLVVEKRSRGIFSMAHVFSMNPPLFCASPRTKTQPVFFLARPCFVWFKFFYIYIEIVSIRACSVTLVCFVLKINSSSKMNLLLWDFKWRFSTSPLKITIVKRICYYEILSGEFQHLHWNHYSKINLLLSDSKWRFSASPLKSL